MQAEERTISLPSDLSTRFGRIVGSKITGHNSLSKEVTLSPSLSGSNLESIAKTSLRKKSSENKGENLSQA